MLDSFRKSTIDSSIKSASERLSQQRKLFSSASSKEAAFQQFCQEHIQNRNQVFEGNNNNNNTNENDNKKTGDFGLIATVSTPAMLMDDLISGGYSNSSQQTLVQSSRVTSMVALSSSNNNTTLLNGFDDGSISLWSVPDGKWLAQGTENSNNNNNSNAGFSGYTTRSVAVSNSSSSSNSTTIMASTHRNGTLVFWKKPELTAASSSSTSKDDDDAQQVSPSPSSSPPVKFHPIASINTNTNSNNSKKSLRQCEFSPTVLEILATSSDDGTVKIWSAASSQLLLSLENGQSSTSQTTSFSSSSTTTTNATTTMKDTATPATRCLSFHPDGALLSVGDASGSFSLWDLRDASRIYNSSSLKPLHSGRINDIKMSLNGYNFFSGGDDGLLYCFDLRKLGPIASSSTPFVWRQAAHGDAVTSICSKTTANSDVIFSGGLDGLVNAWDSWTGDLLWKNSPEISSTGYIPGPKVGKTSASNLPAVRGIVFVGGKYLTVARREPEWAIFSANSGSFMGNRNIKTQLMTTSGLATSSSSGNNPTDAAEKKKDDDVNKDVGGDASEDDSDSDDDILGQLKKK